MKKLLLILAYLVITLSGYGQTTSAGTQTVKDAFGTFVLDTGKTLNQVGPFNYHATLTKPSGSVVVDISSVDNDNKQYSGKINIYSLDLEPFKASFIFTVFKSLLNSKYDTVKISNEATRIYYEMRAQLLDNNDINTAYIRLRTSILPIYLKRRKKIDEKTIAQKQSLDSVELEKNLALKQSVLIKAKRDSIDAGVAKYTAMRDTTNANKDLLISTYNIKGTKKKIASVEKDSLLNTKELISDSAELKKIKASIKGKATKGQKKQISNAGTRLSKAQTDSISLINKLREIRRAYVTALSDNKLAKHDSAVGVSNVKKADSTLNSAEKAIKKVRLEIKKAQESAANFKNKEIVYDYANYCLVKLSVERADVEFEDDKIKNIVLRLKPIDTTLLDASDDGLISFRNNLPIDVSGKFSPDKFRQISVYAYDPVKIENLSKNQIGNYRNLIGSDSNRYLSGATYHLFDDAHFNLADLIDYRIILESGKEDYSPANGVISLTPTNNYMVLKKEPRSKLFEVRTYSDLAGFKGDQPNGLIQIEASKKIFINGGSSDHIWLPFHQKIDLPPHIFFGGLSYIEPSLTLSKLDDNLKNLYLTPADTVLGTKKNGGKLLNVKTIDLYKYQLYNFSLDFNLIDFSIPQWKLNIRGNFKAGIYRASLADSVNIVDSAKIFVYRRASSLFTTTVNSWVYGPEIFVQFLPDSRFGAILGYSWQWNNLENPKYVQSTSRLLHSISFDSFFKSTPDTKLFLRYHYNFQSDKNSLNFSQIQVGFLIDIFKANNITVSN